MQLIPGGSWMASRLNALGVKYGEGMGGGGFSFNRPVKPGIANRNSDMLAQSFEIAAQIALHANQQQMQQQNQQMYYAYPDGSRVNMNSDHLAQQQRMKQQQTDMETLIGFKALMSEC